MLFIKQQDLSFPIQAYVYRFSSVDNLVYCSEDVGASSYVPTTEQANAALAEYQAWCTNFKQRKNADLISLLSSVEAEQAVLLSEVDKQASKFEDNLNKAMYFTSSLGFKVNGDRRTKDNLQDLITFFDLQAQEGSIEYRDYDNVDRKLTKEQLQTLLVEHVANGQGLYTQKWAMQQAINAAKTFEDLQAVSLEFKMLDFSKKSQLPQSVRLGLEKSSSID